MLGQQAFIDAHSREVVKEVHFEVSGLVDWVEFDSLVAVIFHRLWFWFRIIINKYPLESIKVSPSINSFARSKSIFLSPTQHK